MTSSAESSKRCPAHPKTLLLASLLLLLPCGVLAAEHGEVCANPDGVNGTCIGIRSCPPLLSALQAKPLPHSMVHFLRRSQCGFQGRDPLVCCPSTNPPPSASTTAPPVATEDEVTEDVSQHPNLGLLSMDICGTAYEDRIIGGREVDLMAYPWKALLAYTVQSGTSFLCGGSLINERYVLTAAHCVTGLGRNLKVVSVRLGEHNLNSSIDCDNWPEGDQLCAPPPQDIPVEQVIPHPRYTGKKNMQYDIALVRLSTPANFTDEAVLPVCLPVELSLQTEDILDKFVLASGWGVSRERQPSQKPMRASMRVVPHSQCSEAFGGVVSISTVSQICAGGSRDGMASCSGDSGGSLTYLRTIQNRPRRIQQGILSYGPKNCGSAFEPSVYTRVGHFMKWILDTIEP